MLRREDEMVIQALARRGLYLCEIAKQVACIHGPCAAPWLEAGPSPTAESSGQSARSLSMFLGRSFGSRRDVSDEMAREIDLEIKRLITENYERTKRLLTEHMGTLKALAVALFEKESLDALEIDQIISNSSVMVRV